MTNEEFQTATDLQRVRLIKAELDALEASANVVELSSTEGGAILNTGLQSMRRMVRDWEKTLQDSISIRKRRSDAQQTQPEAK